MSKRPLLWLLLIDGLLALWTFRDGLWGGSLLAPLDCGPTLMPKLRFMDPDAGRVPRNHYIIDQFTFDLPCQHTLYEAVRRGEMPWWTPYAFGGQPFLAEAHLNLTDVSRLLCYLTLPFELAYNWTLVLHWFLAGLGMFLLLRHWKFPPWICVGLALAWQFAGCHTLKWGHPWLCASFLYYPALWWAWEAWVEKPRGTILAVASILIGLIFCAGNLQSHAYVVMFAGAFLLGYGGGSGREWKKGLPGVALSGLLGALLALPFLLNQTEFYLQGLRGVAATPPKAWLSGALSLHGVYPWLMGSFRTLDWSKHFSTNALAYRVFVGSVVFVVAWAGWFLKPADPARMRLRRTALWLMVIYFGFIMSTPAQAWLYARAAGLAALGMIVLAAITLEEVLRRAEPMRAMAWAVLAVAATTALAANLEGLVIYPRQLATVREFVLKKAETNPSLDRAPALREFQIANFPNEVSFKNPETVCATFSLLALAAFVASPRWRARAWSLPVVLLLNLAPQAHFHHRFVPRHPVALWQRLREGGPEQERLSELMQDKTLRLCEVVAGAHEYAMPNCLAHLYRIRTVHGYSALQPRSLFTLPAEEQRRHRAQLADYFYTNPERGLTAGVLETNANAGTVVFQWLTASPRRIEARTVSLTEVRLNFGPGPAGNLLWTDTWYPGWQAWSGTRKLPIARAAPCFSQIEIPSDTSTVLLRYRPRFLTLGLAGTFFGILCLLVLGLRACLKTAGGRRVLGAMKILVVACCFNEGEKIQAQLRRYPPPDQRGYDLLLLDDGSTDGSLANAGDFGAKVLSHPRNMGAGRSLRTSFQYALEHGYEAIAIMAGNNKDEPLELSRLLDPIVKEGYDFVQGSRYLRGGNHGNMPVYRRIATQFVHPLLFSLVSQRRITDSTNGFRAIRFTLLRDPRINIEQDWLDRYELEPYLFFKAIRLGYKVREVPCTKIYPAHELGYTKMKPITGWWSILRPLFYLGLGLKK